MHRCCTSALVGGLSLHRLLFARPPPRPAPPARWLRTSARSLQSPSAGAPLPHSQDFSVLLGMLRDKDAQLAAMLASKDAQLAAQLSALLASKDALLAVSLLATRDAAALAAALHERDIATGRVSVRSVLEVVIAELWAEYGRNSKITGATERLRALAKGDCPQLAPYVAQCAAANQLGEAKALAMLPDTYKLLSGPMHALSVYDEIAPVEAVLQGDATALLIVSCLFKLTRRNLQLYRVHKGLREPVVLQLKEPPV